jgi:flagellar basal-body rod modification protein FlgD
MSTIDSSFNTLINELSLGSQQTAQTKKKDSLGQSEFLNLMITQLKNQDPFEPMENGDFIAQMAQFSSVTGLAELQQSFEQLANSLSSNQALQASTLVGRTVIIPGQVGTLTAGGSISGAIDIPVSSDAVTLAIYDSAGQMVRNVDLGMQGAGTTYFEWDGYTDGGTLAPAGRYMISATGRVGKDTGALETFLGTTVESVTLDKGGSGLSLNLKDGNVVGLSSVREIR